MGWEAVPKFIGTPEYLEDKKKRFKSLDLNVAESGAFTIEDESRQFEAEYSRTAPLYYRGQIPGDALGRPQFRLPTTRCQRAGLRKSG